MDVFSRKLAPLPILIVAFAGATAQEASAPQEIVVSFDTFSYVGNTSRADLTGLQITQGDTRIEADRGSANRFDLERSEWTLEGGVRIADGEILIQGEAARFSIRDGELERFELEGEPATFENLDPEESGRAGGGANRISYDAPEGRIELLEEAWLRVGANEVLGCDLIYDVDDESFRSGSTECDRPFRIRVVPEEGSPADGPQQAP